MLRNLPLCIAVLVCTAWLDGLVLMVQTLRQLLAVASILHSCVTKYLLGNFFSNTELVFGQAAGGSLGVLLACAGRGAP